MSIWWLILILFVSKIISYMYFGITEAVNKDLTKSIPMIIAVLGFGAVLTVVSIGYITPLFFNCMFDYFGIDKVIGWKEALGLNLAIVLQFAPINNKKK